MDTEEIHRADGSLVKINDRISCDDNIGTVKFIGPLSHQNANGIWVGVDWDDTTRGKHDGSHKGVQYFQTSSPTSGSFVRPKKINGGVSCFSAIQDRYGISEEENAGVIAEELYVVDSKKKKTVVEMVGAESVNLKQSRLNQLREVVLKDMLIYGVGLHGNDLRTRTSNIRELDISKNLFTSWETVASIAKCLPNLENLNVSENRLEIPSDPTSLNLCFPKIKVLYLNRMQYSWEQNQSTTRHDVQPHFHSSDVENSQKLEILVCSLMFTTLEQLHVCFNCLKSLSSSGCHYQSLKLLNLESNQISSWQEVLNLSNFTRLESLILNDNKIDCIRFPDCGPGQKTQYFPHLNSLYINYNQIANWDSADELNKLQSFQELQITHNPLLASTTTETARQLLIAKIAMLLKCNRTEVEAKERREAEYDYLKRFGPDWLKAGGGQGTTECQISEEFTSQHPRYLHLISVYGAAETSEMNQKPKKLKDSLLLIKVTAPDDPDSRTIEKKVPASMNIQKLKALVQRLFRENSREVKLSYISSKMPGPEIPFDNDLRPISFYSLEVGDTVYARWS